MPHQIPPQSRHQIPPQLLRWASFLLNQLSPYCYVSNPGLSCPVKNLSQEDLHMDANHDAPTMTKYGLEPFEAVIALMVTRYISDHVSKAELGEIINPRVIKLNPDAEDKADRIQPISTDIDAPKLAALLDAAKAWYNTTGRGYDDELMAGFNEAVDQLLSDFDGMRYIQTGPVNFYQYLADLYMRL